MQRRTVLKGLGLLPVLGVLACRRSEANRQGATTSGDQDTVYSSSSTTYTFIEEWKNHQVPLYPGAQLGTFSPLATQVENGGTITFVSSDPPDQILAFYRRALKELGWKLKDSSDRSLTAQREAAFLTIALRGGEGGTTVLLMLTDAL